MAANPLTGIDFDKDRFVIRTGGEITNFSAQWLALEGAPVEGGFPPGQEWFKKLPEASRSAYDHRYSVTGTWNCVLASPPAAVGYPHGVYSETITADIRSPDELKAQVDAMRIDANNSVYPPVDKDAQSALVEDANKRTAAGTATTVDEAILARHASRMDLMRQNEARAMELYADIDAGRAYDLTVGWQRGENSA